MASASTDSFASRRDSRAAIIEDFVALGASRYVAFGLSFVASIVQKGVLGPYAVGVWQALTIVRQYLSFADPGIVRGAERRLPALAATDITEMERYQNTAYTFVLVPMTVVCVLVMLGTFVWPWAVDGLLLWGFRGMILIAWVEALSNTMEVSALRARGRFRLLSVQIFVSEAIFTVTSVPAALVAGVWGLIGALFLSLAFKPVYMQLATGERFRFRWDRARALSLFRVGCPLTIFAVFYKTFDFVDRFMLLGSLESLGYYSVASMTTTFLGHFPLVISTVFFPRTMSWFELRDRGELVGYFQRAQLCILVLVGGACAACYFVMPPIVRALLPSFVAGIPALRIAVFSTIFVSLAQLPIQYLMASNRSWALVVMMAIATGVYYTVGMGSSRWVEDPSAWLEVVAWGRVAAYLALAAFISVWVLRSLAAPLWPWLYELAAVGVFLIALPIAIDVLSPATAESIPGAIGLASAQLGMYGVGLIPVLFLLERRTGVLTSLKDMWQHFHRSRGALDE